MKPEDDVHMLPLTKQEILEVQFAAMNRMFQLNNKKDHKNDPFVQREIQTLGKLVEKCSRHTK